MACCACVEECCMLNGLHAPSLGKPLPYPGFWPAWIMIKCKCDGDSAIQHISHWNQARPCLQDAVAAGVSQAIQQLRNGAISRQHIREGAVQQARGFRAALNAEVQAIFEEHGVRLSAADWFAEHFCHKMGL